MVIESIEAAATHPLRRLVLRDGRADASVVFPEDGRRNAFHLGARPASVGPIVGVASFSPEPTPFRPGRRSVRLRGMAVDPAFQRQGVGRLMLETALDRLRPDGVEVLWANGRDSALGFYREVGMEVLGDGFLTETGVPHHVVLLDLPRLGPAMGR